jgi:uncharacterized coiled-coil protein SlyX
MSFSGVDSIPTPLSQVPEYDPSHFLANSLNMTIPQLRANLRQMRDQLADVEYDQGDEVTVDGDTILDLVAIAEHYLKIAVAAAPPPPDEHLIAPEPEPQVMVAPEPGEEVKPWVPTVEELTDFNSGRIQITPETARAMLPAAGAGLALAEEAAEPDDADHQWVIDQMRAAIKRLTEIVNS